MIVIRVIFRFIGQLTAVTRDLNAFHIDHTIGFVFKLYWILKSLIEPNSDQWNKFGVMFVEQ